MGIVSWCQSIETQDHAPSVDKTYHFPTASLTIAGDLKDVKLKGTIAQLVRALQQPTSSSVAAAGQPKETPEPKPKTTISSGIKKIIHPSQLITKHNIASNHKFGKTLYFGDPIPDTITVSSQSVKVSQANTTGGKRARHLQAFIGNHPSAVRTVEGVRVPDDEADKHHTWRNARVIKGFLVPTGRPANPHKKRQVIITDPQQYLAAAAAAQAQGATTIIDTSGLHGSSTGNNGQPRTSVFYAQEPAHQGLSGGGPSASNSNNGASIFANDPSQQRSHPQVVYPNQQTHQTTNNGQNSAYSYNTPQQNTHSMYVLQDGSAYMQQYNANQAAPSTHQHQAQLVQQQSQSQFFSRSGEASTAPVGSQISQQQQHGSVNSVTASPIHAQQQQPLTAAIKQQYQPSLDTQAIQAAVEAVQQLEAQQQAAQQSANQQSLAAGQIQQQQQQQHQQSQIQAGQQIQIPGLLQQGQQIQIAQGSAPSQTLVLPQGISGGGATAQEILAATAAATNGQVTAQYIQIQPSQEQSLIQQLQQQPQQAQQQYPAANQFAERQNYQTNQQPTQFVIQPHTYVTSSGGPHFSVPIPVPVEQTVVNQQQQIQQQQQQIQHQQQQIQQQQGRHHGQNQHHGNSQTQHHGNGQNQHHGNGQSQHHGNGNHHNQYQQQQHSGGNGNSNNRHFQQGQNQQSSIGDRMKQVFNQNFNRKMLERVETNAVVPALASTGLFLGLSALAAGWYLSKNNREVGIVRRTGKFSKKSGKAPAPASVSSDFPGLPVPEKEEKEGTPNIRTRRDLASMVTPQNYNPSGAPEVDQATFFQSIIQQSLEKTQKDYEDTPVEPLYQQQQPQDNYGGSSHDSGPVYRGDPEPERHGPPSHSMPQQQQPTRQRSKYNRYNDKPPQKYSRDDDYYDSPAASRISKSQQIQEKSGWSVHSAKNFARVAIPAIVLTGAAIGICAVIFGWYISGDNREIAFLESPATQTIGGSASYRKKRSLFGSSSNTAWSDGWLIRTLKAIHGNPYDNMPAPTSKSFVPYPYFLDKDSSKTSNMEFKVSNNGLAGVLAGGAVLAVVALGLINSFSESSGRNLKTARYNHLLTNSASAAKALTNSNSKASTNPLTHLRAPRTMAAHFDNDLEFQQAVSSPSFFESIISSLEASGDTIMNKLHDLGSSNWQKSSCTKRILCTVVTSQGDDTVRIMEKKLASVMKM